MANRRLMTIEIIEEGDTLDVGFNVNSTLTPVEISTCFDAIVATIEKCKGDIIAAKQNKEKGH